ncbi:MAG: hypothetical protein IPF95_14935 [Flavobacteriales bacterium]|nr:hypothetical protein [Flavobacteriales bacterium]MBK6945301.1 hypothetical protein [Flavobacteriales bacterium]MBK7298298.1 hypothetical protein [Flavobacteriales bacterium]MBK9535142.1 hypothetical protein [Flavobacteriales bacterium]MBP9139939.1 hypothetical protein [Flavobacteriales bacterium]
MFLTFLWRSGTAWTVLEIGGAYIGITPANNQMGHGFYQFSPELYFRVFSPENGFEVQKVFLNTNGSIYEVADPLDVGSRVELTNSRPAALVVIAKKVKNIAEFQIPQQSDYVSEWVVDSSIRTGDLNEGNGVIMNYYRKLMPKRLKIIFRNLYDIVTKEKFDVENLGTIDPRHFKKIDLSPTTDELG